VVVYAIPGGRERAMASEGFFERVYEVVEQIPEGMVATYGQVALLAGRPRMPCTAIRAPARFPVTAWCLPMAAYAMVLLLAAPMLSVSS